MKAASQEPPVKMRGLLKSAAMTRPPLLVVYGRQLLARHSPPSHLPQLTRQLVT
jgi:hypothetical protein